MITPRDTPRRLIPRWRSTDESLDPHNSATPAPSARPDIVVREDAWIASPTRSTALELVAVASTTAAPSPAAHEAARWLLDHDEPSRVARHVVERLLADGPSVVVDDLPTPTVDAGRVEIHDEIRRLRAAAHADNRNALAWTELARMHTLIGQEIPALRAMRRALSAAPNHRHVLRAATRLHIHLGDPTTAHRLLLDTPRTRTDPWLLASEISVATLSGRPSRWVKAARLLLEARAWSKRDITELAGAVGTIELDAGKDRRARDLFRLSLDDPNDNSLAQAEWATERVPTLRENVASALEHTPRSWEAEGVAAAVQRRHDEAAQHAWAWLLDQPFSSEAACFGSYEASITKDYELSLEFARRGLIANPRHFMLRNNAAFALAKLDRPKEAQAQLDRVPVHDLTAHDRAVHVATSGLVAIRSGQIEVGQKLYEQAIETAPDSGTRVRAQLMLAVELLRLQAPGIDELVAAIRDNVRAHLNPPDHSWLDHLSL